MHELATAWCVLCTNLVLPFQPEKMRILMGCTLVVFMILWMDHACTFVDSSPRALKHQIQLQLPHSRCRFAADGSCCSSFVRACSVLYLILPPQSLVVLMLFLLSLSLCCSYYTFAADASSFEYAGAIHFRDSSSSLCPQGAPRSRKEMGCCR